MIARLRAKLQARLVDVVLSVYILNESRGADYLDRLAAAFASAYPEEKKLQAAIYKHAADERKHYELFRAYFRERGRFPIRLTLRYGYCDALFRRLLGEKLDELDPALVLTDEKRFFRLCRTIMITERRGMGQVQIVLKNPAFRGDARLREIFEVIERDEPSHCYPYQTWLRQHGEAEVSWRERWTDLTEHYALILLKIPFLYLNVFLPRLRTF